MPRKPRIEYPGAAYHVMSRGDHRQDIYRDDADREMFMATLGEACERTGWRIHSYVLMSNHYHLLLETPEANLVAGMRWLQGTYTQRFHVRHQGCGHLFQGRYKAISVESDDTDYFSVVCEYIHLNPARARLFDLEREDLTDYRWSSYPLYLKPTRRPEWLETGTLFSCLGMQDDMRGRRVFREDMRRNVRELAHSDRPWEADERWAQIRRGWFLGSDTFRDFLLERLAPSGKRESFSGEEIRKHDEREAERLVRAGLVHLGLNEETLRALRKGSEEKTLLAWLVRRQTAVPNEWIARRLDMGRPDCLSRYPRCIAESRDRKIIRKRNALAKITRIRD